MIRERVRMPADAGSIGQKIVDKIIWGEHSEAECQQKRLRPANIWVKGKKMSYSEYCDLVKEGKLNV